MFRRFIAFLIFAAPLAAQSAPQSLEVTRAPLAIRVLVQSPADTAAELQVICLFQATKANPLSGSLQEIDDKLHGLLSDVRRPVLFNATLGETLLLTPPAGTLPAKRVLIVGLGDSYTFAPERMELVGSVVYREAQRLGVRDLFFAPTIKDGGVDKFTTGEVSEHFMRGFLYAMDAEQVLIADHASPGEPPRSLTYLAGPKFAEDTQRGIEKALAERSH